MSYPSKRPLRPANPGISLVSAAHTVIHDPMDQYGRLKKALTSSAGSTPAAGPSVGTGAPPAAPPTTMKSAEEEGKTAKGYTGALSLLKAAGWAEGASWAQKRQHAARSKTMGMSPPGTPQDRALDLGPGKKIASPEERRATARQAKRDAFAKEDPWRKTPSGEHIKPFGHGQYRVEPAQGKFAIRYKPKRGSGTKITPTGTAGYFSDHAPDHLHEGLDAAKQAVAAHSTSVLSKSLGLSGNYVSATALLDKSLASIGGAISGAARAGGRAAVRVGRAGVRGARTATQAARTTSAQAVKEAVGARRAATSQAKRTTKTGTKQARGKAEATRAAAASIREKIKDRSTAAGETTLYSRPKGGPKGGEKPKPPKSSKNKEQRTKERNKDQKEDLAHDDEEIVETESEREARLRRAEAGYRDPGAAFGQYEGLGRQAMSGSPVAALGAPIAALQYEAAARAVRKDRKAPKRSRKSFSDAIADLNKA